LIAPGQKVKQEETSMNLRAITANLGGGGPTATKYKTAADEWAEHVREVKTLDLLFVQEVHDEAWLDAWSAPDWHVVVGSGQLYKPRSPVVAVGQRVSWR